jgi:2-polyprenyl-3-methyl-5-hydroxy-6-metoxy-1,4-benzoquinol methylase
MKIGPAFRRLLPARLERKIAGLYRSIFVDLRCVARLLAPQFPHGAKILDVGGGDGELLNHLFRARPDLHVTMVDVSATVGKFVEPQYRGKIRLLPHTLIEDHLADAAGSYDAAVISDVLHHIPVNMRRGFIANVHKALRPHGRLLIKDIEPGHFISRLSLFSDKNISGDKGVVLISRAELVSLASQTLPAHTWSETSLLSENRPNYLVTLDFK